MKSGSSFSTSSGRARISLVPTAGLAVGESAPSEFDAESGGSVPSVAAAVLMTSSCAGSLGAPVRRHFGEGAPFGRALANGTETAVAPSGGSALSQLGPAPDGAAVATASSAWGASSAGAAPRAVTRGRFLCAPPGTDNAYPSCSGFRTARPPLVGVGAFEEGSSSSALLLPNGKSSVAAADAQSPPNIVLRVNDAAPKPPARRGGA